jgi:hypothetical protein
MLAASAALAAHGIADRPFRLSARATNAAFEAAFQKLISECGTCDPPFGNRYSAAECQWTVRPDVAECRLSVRHFRGRARPIVNKFKRIDDRRWIALFD